MQWENMKANLQAYFICCVRAKTRLNTSKHGRTVHRRSVRSVKKQRTHRHDMKFPWSALFPCRFIKQSTINSTILLQLCKRTETKRYKWIEDSKHHSIAVKNQSNAQTILNHFSVFMLSHLALFSFMRMQKKKQKCLQNNQKFSAQTSKTDNRTSDSKSKGFVFSPKMLKSNMIYYKMCLLLL